MFSQPIACLDGALEQSEKILDLAESAEQAARHIWEEPDSAAEMRELIDQAAQAIHKNWEAQFPKSNRLEELTARLDDIQATPDDRLVQAVRSWRGAVQLGIGEDLFENLVSYRQISPAAARRLERIIVQTLPLGREDQGTFLFETAYRCGFSDAGASARLMLLAFERSPGVLKGKREWLQNFVFEAGKHPQREFTTCPVCGGAGVAYRNACACYMLNYNPMFLPAKLWMRCQNCETLYTRWFPQEFLALGQKPYLVYPRADWVTIQDCDSVRLRSWCDILNKAKELAKNSGTKLLEVGVGNGYLIAAAQEMGYQVHAVEILEDAAQETADLLNLPVLCGDFLAMPEDQDYDIIIMGDVLEHLQDPVGGLNKAFSLLKPGGVLWLSTPNYDSAFARMRKMTDPMLQEPYHITYFSRQSLARLVEQVGFQIKSYSLSIHYNGSMEFFLQK